MQSESTAEPTSTAESESIGESEPAAESETAAESESAAESEPATGPETAPSPDSAAELDSTRSADSTAEPGSAAASESDSEAESTTDDDSARRARSGTDFAGRSRPSVCVFTTAHNAGDARVYHREAVSLAQSGYDVTYYAPRGDIDDDRIDLVTYGSLDDEADVPGIGDRLKIAGAAARELLGTDYDVYHFHDVELLPVGVQLAATTDGAVIYDVHENVRDVLGHKEIFPDAVRDELATVAGGTELALSKVMDALVVASPDVAERFDGFDEVTTVTNYPQRRWAEETDMTAKAERATDGEATVAYCGLLSEERGILTLVEAVERVPEEYDVSLVLGGKFDSDEFRDRLTARVDDSDRVELRGWLPTLEDVIDMFREADVGAFTFYPDPNKDEAVHRSNKLFQYMAAGLPVVVSDVGDWRTVVDDVGCGVTVDPEDPDAVAAALADMAADADRRVELGRNGHEAALERYNWDTQRDRLLDLYDRLT